MTNHPNRNCRYYAAQSPRGFANEVVVHAFSSRAERNEWVAAHENDGGRESARIGARVISASRAREILGYCGDGATQSYNGLLEH